MCTTIPDATLTGIAAEVAEPGSGFSTVTWNDIPFCAAVEVPVAVRWVEDTNLVISGCPLKITLAPLTNFVPVTVSVKFPTGTAAGDTAVTVGTGFSSVIAFVPKTVLLEEEVASMVTELGEGRAAGAGKRRLPEILPTVAFPPATPLTDQVTLWLIVAVTFAVNCSVSPARSMLALELTVTPCEEVWPLPEPPPRAEQPSHARSPMGRRNVVMSWLQRILAVFSIHGPLCVGPELQSCLARGRVVEGMRGPKGLVRSAGKPGVRRGFWRHTAVCRNALRPLWEVQVNDGGTCPEVRAGTMSGEDGVIASGAGGSGAKSGLWP